MKKLKFLFLIMLTTFMSVSFVNAETLVCDFNSNYESFFSRFGKDFVIGELDKLYDIYVNEYQNEYPFYQIEPEITYNGVYYLRFKLIVYTKNPIVSWYETLSEGPDFYTYFAHYNHNPFIYKTILYEINSDDSLSSVEDDGTISTSSYLRYDEDLECSIYAPFYTSLTPLFVMPNFEDITQVKLQTKPGSEEYYVFDENTDSYMFQPYSTYLGLNKNDKNYTEVNLDDYEYVILNLKDYSKKEAFETNLQVKGSVGITPLYNYGQAEKSVVTDRCNLSYSDFTNYRFFVLKNDLTNNAFYIVKACEENSAFRFDSTIFDVTYVTTENVDDPVVTFGGVEYHTLSFNKLSNSANQNESNNFIPGESGSSLTDIIDNVSDFTSDIWNAISSFMGLVTKFFNTLPEEFRYLSITSFTVLTFIAIIKFIKS